MKAASEPGAGPALAAEAGASLLSPPAIASTAQRFSNEERKESRNHDIINKQHESKTVLKALKRLKDHQANH